MLFDDFEHAVKSSIASTLNDLGMSDHYQISLAKPAIDIDIYQDYKCDFLVDFSFGKYRDTKKITVGTENLKTIGIVSPDTKTVIPITYGSLMPCFLNDQPNDHSTKKIH